MRRIQLMAFLVACCVATICNAEEPAEELEMLLKRVCGGQWMIDEDRFRLVETRAESDGSLRSRSSFVDNCFARIIRTDTYRYDKSTKKLTANIKWSSGFSWECDGDWDQETKTLTWMARMPSGTRSFSYQVISPRVTKFSIHETDAQGKSTLVASEKRYLIIE